MCKGGVRQKTIKLVQILVGIRMDGWKVTDPCLHGVKCPVGKNSNITVFNEQLFSTPYFFHWGNFHSLPLLYTLGPHGTALKIFNLKVFEHYKKFRTPNLDYHTIAKPFCLLK